MWFEQKNQNFLCAVRYGFLSPQSVLSQVSHGKDKNLGFCEKYFCPSQVGHGRAESKPPLMRKFSPLSLYAEKQGVLYIARRRIFEKKEKARTGSEPKFSTMSWLGVVIQL